MYSLNRDDMDYNQKIKYATERYEIHHREEFVYPTHWTLLYPLRSKKLSIQIALYNHIDPEIRYVIQRNRPGYCYYNNRVIEAGGWYSTVSEQVFNRWVSRYKSGLIKQKGK